MSVQRVYLIETKTGQKVAGSLFDEISDEHLKKWKQAWVPEFDARKAKC
jgi:hypothetical protein